MEYMVIIHRYISLSQEVAYSNICDIQEGKDGMKHTRYITPVSVCLLYHRNFAQLPELPIKVILGHCLLSQTLVPKVATVYYHIATPVPILMNTRMYQLDSSLFLPRIPV